MAIKLEDIKTQEELDAVLEKQRSEVSKAAAERYKIDNDAIIKATNENNALKEQLEKANAELYETKQVPGIKEKYKALGGKEEFFNDFMKLNGDSFKAEGAKEEDVFKTLHEEQKHYFTEKAPTPEQVAAAKAAAEPIGGGKPAEGAKPDFTGKSNPYVRN